MTNTLTEKHPSYSEFTLDWIQCRDCYAGSRRIKFKNTVYLPATSGMVQDGYPNPQSIGGLAYDAYIKRAYYPNFFKEAVVTAIGMIHSEDAEISLPRRMADIRSSEGETMLELLRRINEEQLKVGRVGLFLDLPVSGSDVPYVTTYAPERIINWNVDDGKLLMVVLDETDFELRQDGFSWESIEKYRVLRRGPPYSFAVYEEADIKSFSEDDLKSPSIRGRTLGEIPFVFINSQDLLALPDAPPLMDLSELCLTIYRGEADFRQNLFMQGQDTLVIIGGTNDDQDQVRTGAGSMISVPMQGDAKFIGVTSDGLEEQRLSLKEDRLRAGSMGAQSIDTVSRERESGASLNVRMGARTASLNQLVKAGAGGLEKVLKMAAVWMGENPDEVSITPNEEFGEFPLTGQSMVEMQTAKNLGFPISRKSLHEVARDKGLTRMTFEQEEVLISSDPPPPVTGGDRSPENQGGRDGS